MSDIYILDTSVLIHDPQSFKTFKNSTCILPITVLDELDKLKKQFSEAGKNARHAIHLIDEISMLGDISTGILLEDNIFFKIDTNNYPTKHGDSLYGDTRIVACADAINIVNQNVRVVLVSNDINLRVRARAIGILAEGYNKNKTSSNTFEGMRDIENIEAGDELISHGKVDPRHYELDIFPNEFVSFVDDNGEDIASGRKVAPGCIKLVKKSYPWGVSPRNKEQTFSLDILTDLEVPLITLTGKAGCGKSLMALAAGLDLVVNRRSYDKFIIFRPIQPVGKDIGYLKGDLEEKLEPWFKAIMDNFEILFHNKNGDKWKHDFDMYKRRELIQFDVLVHLRGRSIPNAVILIDEAQNTNPEEIKTIITRAGENTKIIMTGDLDQIDNPELDASHNGLAYAIEKFKHSELSGHITFSHGERSALATEASNIL